MIRYTIPCANPRCTGVIVYDLEIRKLRGLPRREGWKCLDCQAGIAPEPTSDRKARR